MFSAEDLKVLDPKYFSIITVSDYDVTIMSRNTGHIWYIHNPEYPGAGTCIIFHKHKVSHPYHQHGRTNTLRQAVRSIRAHDRWQKMRKEGIPMAGRKPKPTAIKELEGNPGKRKLNKKEPKPEKGMPVCPDWLLPEAKAEWKRLCEKLNQMGVLTEVDMAAFAAYCQSYARWKEAQEHIDSGGSTFETEKGYQQQTPWVGIANTNQKLMLQAAAEFGLTPSARTRIMAAVSADKESEDEMEALLGGDS